MNCETNEEALDPRIREELEKLNESTKEINRLEKLLDDKNCGFSSLFSESSASLATLLKKVGSNVIDKARPYYVALESSQKAQKDCQTAATNYQRAHWIHAAAKETIALAEQRFLSNSKDWKFDNTWQEMLNHATVKVVEAERVKTQSRIEHSNKAAAFTEAEKRVQSLEKSLHKFIRKAEPFFSEKKTFDDALEAQKAEVQRIQAKISACKEAYAKSLRNLEEISESIHASRKMNRYREPGVGAEHVELCS